MFGTEGRAVRVLALLAGVLVGGSAAAQGSVVVLPVEGAKVLSAEQADRLTAALVEAVKQRTGARVLKPSEVEPAAGGAQALRSLTVCGDVAACPWDRAERIGAERMILAGLEATGAKTTLRVQLVHVPSRTLERRYTRQLHDHEEETLASAFEAAVDALVAPRVGAGPRESGAEGAGRAGLPPAPSTTTVTRAARDDSAPRFSLALRGQGWPLDTPGLKRGGATALLVGAQLSSSVSLSVGPMTSFEAAGGLIQLAWAFANAEGAVRPVLALEVPVLVAFKPVPDPVAVGVGGSVGVEWVPVSWLSLGVEVPVYFLLTLPPGNPHVWIFGAATAGIRF